MQRTTRSQIFIKSEVSRRNSRPPSSQGVFLDQLALYDLAYRRLGHPGHGNDLVQRTPRATRADLEELAAALPDCRGVHVVPDGGRFVNYIQGDEVNRLIREFYGTLEA